MTKHHDRDNLQKERLIWGLTVSDGESTTVMAGIPEAGRHSPRAAAESLQVEITSVRKRGNWNGNDTASSTKPHL